MGADIAICRRRVGALRDGTINPPLLGMSKVMSEDLVQSNP